MMLKEEHMWITGAVTVLSALTGVPEPWDLARLATYRHQEPAPEARIWLDRGIDPILQRGDRVRVYYRSNVSAYVAILQVDTDGTVRLQYPRSPSENHYARAGRDYRLLFPRSPYWHVNDRAGVGYFFIVTSPRPFDFSDFRYSYFEGGWDLSLVGNRVHGDPYLAMDDFVARLVPDWEYAAYGLDFVSYSVGAAHAYPRFLCYDCHGFKPYNIWNPYHYTCTNFRVIVYDDPYFYPSRRYRGDRIVFVGGSVRSGPRFGFKERARGEPGTPIVRRVPAEGRDNGSVTSDRQRGRAIPRGVRPAPDEPRPSTTRPSDPTAGDRGARVGAPATGQGKAERRDDSSGSRRASPGTAPDVKRPVLKKRPPPSPRPSTRARTSPTPRVNPRRSGLSSRAAPPPLRSSRSRGSAAWGRSSPPSARTPPAGSARRSPPATRRPPARSSPAPVARRPPGRSGGPATTRSSPTRSRPAAKRPPPRRPGGASSGGSLVRPRTRRPGG